MFALYIMYRSICPCLKFNVVLRIFIDMSWGVFSLDCNVLSAFGTKAQ